MKKDSFTVESSMDEKQFFLRHITYLPNRGGTPFGYNAGGIVYYDRQRAFDAKKACEDAHREQLDNKLMTYIVGGRIILAADINQAARAAREDQYNPTVEPVRPIERGEYIVGYGFII